jgi:small conductance mechanosensitive channel
MQQWAVGREYNRRLKMELDRRGIEIPFPQRTVHIARDSEEGVPKAA